MRGLMMGVVVVTLTGTYVSTTSRPRSQSATNSGAHSMDPCTVPQQAKARLGGTRRSAGIEYLPLPCGRHSADYVNEVRELGTLPLPDALDRLVASDSRYQWRVVDNIVVLRPADAWVDSDDFLNGHIGSLTFTNENVGGALNVFATTLAHFPVTGIDSYRADTQPPDMHRRFSVTAENVSVLTALNAMV